MKNHNDKSSNTDKNDLDSEKQYREKLKLSFSTQGWKQLLTARKEMLDAFDSAREKAKSHKVEVHHGRVAEGQFRKWLSDFLPRRYGVTSGYIVSQGLKSTDKSPHFDVIIYDQLESPVLWIEDNPDSSSQGRSLAIPVEYVRGVLEIKSKFSASNVGDAITHLNELLPLMAGSDSANERYKLYLPTTFLCGLVFFDLKSDFQFSEKALSNIILGIKLRGFFGAVILRGEGHSKPLTGRISLFKLEKPIETKMGSGKQSLLKTMGFFMKRSVQKINGFHIGCQWVWAEFGFSQFGFDFIAMMQGKYDPGWLSSFYGMGGFY